MPGKTIHLFHKYLLNTSQKLGIVCNALSTEVYNIIVKVPAFVMFTVSQENLILHK